MASEIHSEAIFLCRSNPVIIPAGLFSNLYTAPEKPIGPGFVRNYLIFTIRFSIIIP